MSTRIDISFTDERLLRDNKRRTAANQQALDTRTQLTKEQQAAEQAAIEATPEERPSGVPDLRLERRPAAQRRKKDEYDLAFVNKYFVETVLNSQTTINPGAWPYISGRVQVEGTLTCPGNFNNIVANVVQDRATAFTQGVLDNFYSEFATQVAPTLNYRNVTHALPPRVQTQTNNVVPSWLLEIDNFFTESTTSCTFPFNIITFSGRVASNGPEFPRSKLYPAFLALLPLVSSTPQYIHFTLLLRERQYDLTSAMDLGVAGFQTPYFNPSAGFNTNNSIGSTARRIAAKDFIESIYGYYIRFNVVTRIIESRLIPFDIRAYTSQIITRNQPLSISSFVSTSIQEQLLAAMYATDPRRSLSSVVAALDPDINVFSYDPNVGSVYFHGQILGAEKLDRYLYSTLIPRNTPYTSVFYLLKSAKGQLSTLPEAPVTFTVKENKSSIAPYPLSIFTRRQTLLASSPGIQAPIIGIVPRLQR